jgi:hypothetical protein
MSFTINASLTSIVVDVSGDEYTSGLDPTTNYNRMTILFEKPDISLSRRFAEKEKG